MRPTTKVLSGSLASRWSGGASRKLGKAILAAVGASQNADWILTRGQRTARLFARFFPRPLQIALVPARERGDLGAKSPLCSAQWTVGNKAGLAGMAAAG